jgi:Kef-type K+ transport system membrane component KefB
MHPLRGRPRLGSSPGDALGVLGPIGGFPPAPWECCGVVPHPGAAVRRLGLGLLYLMFLAGVELDLDEFRAHRADAALFGTLTFLLPMVIVALAATVLGYGLAAAILLASCFASHTLIAYPAFQRLGTFANRAVVTAVGGTILTDTAALLVLAVVANSTRGELGMAFWATLIPSMGVIVFLALVTLPRQSRRFFSGAGQDGTLRFLWVLVATFLVASLVETAGVEAIIGAFLAGIALSRAIPAGGLLMERIEFVGASIFVPLFLISVGMLVDLSVLADPRTLGIGLAFTVATIVAKYTAAWVTGRIRGFSRAEVAALFAMSVAQAAATLAAVIVGFDGGLLDEPTVNAVILVILLTCVLASVVAARVAPILPRPERARPLGSRVVVAIGNPASAARLLRSGSLFAVADSGVVVPLLMAPRRSATRSSTASVSSKARRSPSRSRAVPKRGVRSGSMRQLTQASAARSSSSVRPCSSSGGPGRARRVDRARSDRSSSGCCERRRCRPSSPTTVVRRSSGSSSGCPRAHHRRPPAPRSSSRCGRQRSEPPP